MNPIAREQFFRITTDVASPFRGEVGEGLLL